jgi:putative transposase
LGKIRKRETTAAFATLIDRSRRPYDHANPLLAQIETLLVRGKQEHPHWGTPKIGDRPARLYPDNTVLDPDITVLGRHGLVKRRGVGATKPLAPVVNERSAQ